MCGPAASRKLRKRPATEHRGRRERRWCVLPGAWTNDGATCLEYLLLCFCASMVENLACGAASGPCPQFWRCQVGRADRRNLSRSAQSYMNAIRGCAGRPGRNGLGPRETGGHRRWPSAECGSRATTVYGAVRICRVGTVWGRANRAAAGEDRARNADLEQRPYTRLSGSAGCGWCGSARTEQPLGKAGRGMPTSSNDPIRGYAGQPGADGGGPREPSSRWGRSGAECRPRATTLYAAMRVGRVRMVWVRANRAAAGEGRARNADLEQRPYTRLCGSAGCGWCGSVRTEQPVEKAGHGMRPPRNDPIRGCASRPGADGVGPRRTEQPLAKAGRGMPTSSNDPIRGYAGQPGADGGGPREPSSRWGRPGAECRPRATTLYAAMRVGWVRMVWVRANRAAAGEGRAQNADLEQRPYTGL